MLNDDQSDPQSDSPSDRRLDDTCLAHHFIRTHGRRPTAEELLALRTMVVVPRPRHAGTPLTLPQSLRREVARLIHRL